MLNFSSSAYGWLLLAGIFISFRFWWRLARRDSRLVYIYFAALGGAFIGAKLVYICAEGWLHWHDQDRWVQFATGKSIIGGLLGGYAAVEIAKLFLGYHRATGDWFAVMMPITIMLGRIGCILHGCCLGRQCSPSWFTMRDSAGVARWPAAGVELIFNAVMLALVLLFKRRKILPGQHFHLYLMIYGLFRFLHEFLRETPQVVGPLSGYQLASLAVLALGLLGFLRRRNSAAPVEPSNRPLQRSIG
jgi:phosphatidylglycerol:prolipoprotein diacylglycerol transferase